MAKNKDRVSLSAIAAAMQVHPRTVLRAVSGDKNAYWAEGYDPEVSVAEVALAFGADERILHWTLQGKDKLLKPIEAAQRFGIQPRTFRYRGYPAAVRLGGVVRYSRYEIANYDAQHFATDDIRSIL